MSTVFIRKDSQVKVTDKLNSEFLGMTGRVLQVDDLCKNRWFLVEFILYPDTDHERKVDCWFEEHHLTEM